MKITAEDQRHFTAAEGWLELGDHVAAFEELENLQPLCRAHPVGLKLRWRIYAKAGKWESAFELAEGLTRMLPDELEPFIWRSYSARRMRNGGVLHAFELLQDVVDDFPDESVVSFNLACYSIQLERSLEARSWLHIAFEVARRNGTKKHWMLKALDEKDLEPLWREIRAAVAPKLKSPPLLKGIRGVRRYPV